MAHNLNFNEKLNRHAFVTVKEPAWHRLGLIVDKAMNSEEAMRLGGLDYMVRKADVYASFPNKALGVEAFAIDYNKVPNKFVTYREDTEQMFGMVTDRYEIVQNIDGFKFFDDIVGAGKAIFETAGVLGNGETVFITAKLPDYIRVGNGDDIIEKYLLLTMNHSGEGSIMATFTPIRVVCNNTMSAALNYSRNIIKIRHTKSAKDNLEKGMELLNLANILSANSQTIFNTLAVTAMSDIQTKDYIHTLFLTKDELQLVATNKGDIETVDEISTRKKNIVRDVKLYNQQGTGQDMVEGTAWGAYNAVTGYFQNVKNYTSDEVKFKNIMGGADAQIGQKALTLAYDIATS